MAARSETLQLIISAKDAASADMSKVGSLLHSMHGNVKNLIGSLFSLKSAFVGLGAGLIARDFLQTAASFEKYNTQLVTITGSAGRAEKAMTWIEEFTAKTPYELDQVTAAFTKLSAYGVDPTSGKLKVLGDTASAMGKDINQAVEMFADAITGEFERLKEFGIRASQEGDKVTFRWMQNGQQMVKEAEKTQEGISRALTEILDARFAGAMERYSSTWTGMLSNLSDQWTMWQKDVMEGGVFDYLKQGLSVVLQKVNELREQGKLKEWAKEAAEGMIQGFESMLLGAAKFYDGFSPIMAGIKKGFELAWNFFKELPPWVQTIGVLGAVMGGKAFALGGTAYLAALDIAEKFGNVIRAMREGIITMQEWKDMTVEQRMQFAGMLQEAREFNELGGQVVRMQIQKPVKDFWAEFDKADSATEKVKVLLQYMRQLREEQKPETPASARSSAATSASAAGSKGWSDKDLDDYLKGVKEREKAEQERSERLGQLYMVDMEESNKRYLAIEEREKMLADLKLRLAKQTSVGLQGEFLIEQGEMDMRHQQEIERLKKLYATKEEIENAYQLQKAEKEALMLDQEKRAQSARLELAQSVAGGMATAFTNLYELTGKKHKEFFYLAKAAAIAEATMNVAQGVTKALAQGGFWGPIMAGVVVASGAVQLATIAAQKMARGGLVKLGSGLRDDVPAMLTRGEYVIRRQAVEALGANVLERINSLQAPVFAGGGLVGGMSGSASGASSRSGSLTIANFIDPAEFERFMATARGQNAVVNVISQKASIVRKALR